MRDGEVDAGKSHEELDLFILISDCGEFGGEESEFGFDLIEEAELGVEGIASVLVDGDLCAEPEKIGDGEEIAGGVGDEALVEDGVGAVFDASAVADEHGALRGEIAHAAGLVVGDPDGGKEIGAEELGEDERIDLIGFDFGLRDGLGTERVGDDDVGAEGLEKSGDGPGVGGGFDGDGAVEFEGVDDGEVGDGVARGGEASAVDYFALAVDNAGFDFFFMEVETGEAM